MKNINGWLYRTPTLVERFKNALQGWRKPILVGRNTQEHKGDTTPNLISEDFKNPS